MFTRIKNIEISWTDEITVDGEKIGKLIKVEEMLNNDPNKILYIGYKVKMFSNENSKMKQLLDIFITADSISIHSSARRMIGFAKYLIENNLDSIVISAYKKLRSERKKLYMARLWIWFTGEGTYNYIIDNSLVTERYLKEKIVMLTK